MDSRIATLFSNSVSDNVKLTRPHLSVVTSSSMTMKDSLDSARYGEFEAALVTPEA